MLPRNRPHNPASNTRTAAVLVVRVASLLLYYLNLVATSRCCGAYILSYCIVTPLIWSVLTSSSRDSSSYVSPLPSYQLCFVGGFDGFD